MFAILIVVSLVDLSAVSFFGMSEFPGLDWMSMEKKMEVINSLMKDVQAFDDRSALYGDLLSVQISIINDGWLTVVDV